MKLNHSLAVFGTLVVASFLLFLGYSVDVAPSAFGALLTGATAYCGWCLVYAMYLASRAGYKLRRTWLLGNDPVGIVLRQCFLLIGVSLCGVKWLPFHALTMLTAVSLAMSLVIGLLRFAGKGVLPTTEDEIASIANQLAGANAPRSEATLLASDIDSEVKSSRKHYDGRLGAWLAILLLGVSVSAGTLKLAFDNKPKSVHTGIDKRL